MAIEGMTNFTRAAAQLGFYIGANGAETQVINSSGNFVGSGPIFTGNVLISGTLGVTNAVTFSSASTHTGVATFNGAITSNTAATFNGAVTFNGNMTLGSAATDTISVNSVIRSDLSLAKTSAAALAILCQALAAQDSYILFEDSDNTDNYSVGFDASSNDFSIRYNNTGNSNPSSGSQYLRITNAGIATFINRLNVTLSQTASTQVVITNSTINDAASAKIRMLTGATGGDPYVHFEIDTAQHYSLGADNSDNNYFKLCAASTLGSTAIFQYTPSGAVFYPGHTTTGDAANAVLNSSTGALQRSTSSKRYKKNIENMDIDTSKLYNLRPVEWDDKAVGTHHFGLVAEEVQEIMPELVTYIPESKLDPKSNSDKLVPDAVKYPMLSVLLLQEVKKLKAKIDSLA